MEQTKLERDKCEVCKNELYNNEVQEGTNIRSDKNADNIILKTKMGGYKFFGGQNCEEINRVWRAMD